MADEPIKRLRYFTGQFLEAADFATEQSYHVNLRRRGNQALYLAGILDGGFNVTYLSSERKVQISPGVGVDAQGRELVIVSALTESPPPAGTHFVTLTYQEIEMDLQSQTGADAVSEKTRFDETPKVKFFPDGTSIDKDTFIVLAKITVDNAGTVSGINTSVRQYSVGRFPGSLTVSGNVGIGVTSPAGRLTLDGIVQPGQGRLTFFSSSADVEYDGGTDGIFLFRNTTQNGKTAFVGGNIGIGTANPSAGLEIDKGPTNDVALLLNSSGPGWGSGMQLRNTAQGGRSYGIYSGFGNLHFTDIDASVDRLLIHSSGNIGIGTSSPTSGKLQFDNNLGNKVVIYDNGQTDRYGFGLNGGNLNAFVPAGGRFSVRQNGYDGTEVMSITGTGNVHVQGDTLRVSYKSNEGPRLLLHNPQKTGLGNEWAIYNMTGHYGDSLQFWNYGGNGWGSKLTIKDNGNVGIGTTTPRANLEIPGGGILNGLAIGVDPPPVPGVGDTAFPFPYETIGTVDPRHNLRLHSNNLIAFHTGNAQTPKATINGDGHMVVNGNIGTSSQSPTDGLPNGWGGGVHTWDLVAEGSVWAAHYVYCQDAQVKKRDLAENYSSESALEPGDVVCLDPKEDRIVKSERANDGLLLGVISTSPGLLLGAEHSEDDQCNAQERLYPVALSGRVPCKVTDENGSISRGDFLTSSLTPGCAMKAAPVIVGGVEIYAPGTIIGKALESFTVGTGVIEVFVTLK